MTAPEIPAEEPTDEPGGVPIRAATVLPAHREDVELHTADGFTLVGELATPVDREPLATLVTLHPLPTHGGSMDSHVLRKMSWRLPALAGLAVLRFNLRGVTSPRGTSEGAFDAGDAERFDVAAAIELAEFRELPRRWLLGWSFGTDLVLLHGCDPAVEGAVLLSPPLRYSRPEHLRTWAGSGKPVLALVPEHDDYLQPPAARQAFAPLEQARVVGVDGAKHLWVGENAVRRVLQEVVDEVLPERGGEPLPTHWDGPYEVADDLRTARPSA